MNSVQDDPVIRTTKLQKGTLTGMLLVMDVAGYCRYSQIKFNLLNWHIIDNKTDKKPGLFAALFALVFMIGGGHVSEFLLVNYLPRLVPGMLLLYAAMPLVENNLILSWGQVTRKEFFAIWVIVIINAVSGQCVFSHIPTACGPCQIDVKKSICFVVCKMVAYSGVWTHYSFLIAIGCGLILATFIFAFEYVWALFGTSILRD